MKNARSQPQLATCRMMGVFVAFGALLVFLCSAGQSRGGELTKAEFDRLHRKLTKMSNERVWSIPWQLSVREARKLAAKDKKPVFLWISSNGGTHPLGPC